MFETKTKMVVIAAIALVLSLLGAGVLRAQDTNQGPMAPPPTFKVHRMPSEPHPGPPPIPQEQIIEKFSANEDAAKKALDTYDFTQTIRVEELTDPGGKFTAVGESYVKPDGTRFWRVTKPAETTLKLTKYSLEDVRTILNVPSIFLTSDEIGNYNFTYLGQQKLDELNTYIFQVKPKTLNRTRRFFDGIVYVDDHDLAIVESYGKFVSEMTTPTGAQLPFSMFEMYRENFQQKYWLPTYMSSDDYLGNGDEQIHLRLVVRDTEFKPNAQATPAVTTQSQTGQPSNAPTK
jgi:hypothetical protein